MKYIYIYTLKVQDQTKNSLWDDPCKGFPRTTGQSLVFGLPGYIYTFFQYVHQNGYTVMSLEMGPISTGPINTVDSTLWWGAKKTDAKTQKTDVKATGWWFQQLYQLDHVQRAIIIRSRLH